jgi:hypothetical protein
MRIRENVLMGHNVDYAEQLGHDEIAKMLMDTHFFGGLHFL